MRVCVGMEIVSQKVLFSEVVNNLGGRVGWRLPFSERIKTGSPPFPVEIESRHGIENWVNETIFSRKKEKMCFK